MKHYKLDKEEQELLDAVERGEFVPVKNQKKAIKDAIAIATYTLNKKKNINIRLAEVDVYRIKAKAIEVGIPYQTLIRSVLHRFANKQEDIGL